MIDEISKRHGVGEHANGREAHPDIKPYDAVMLKMIKEMENADAQKQAAKDKQAFKHSTMLSHEFLLCTPLVNMSKRTEAVLNKEGEEIEEESAPSSVSTTSSAPKRV